MTLTNVQSWFGVSETIAMWLAGGMVVLAALLAYYVSRAILLHIIYRWVRRTPTDWDDILVERKVPRRALHVFPIIIIYYFAYLFPGIEALILRFCHLYITFISAWLLNGFLNAVVDIYNRQAVAKSHPIKGVIQIVQIVLWLTAVIVAVSIILQQSPVYLLSGLGAMTAILLLVFRDTILGFVAGLQISLNQLVQLGDWLEVPQFGADGVVIDVALHTVQIQNWDKTITVIPTYKLIDGSFKNWRGMSESGGRRIMRAVYIDMNSIRFCDDEMLKKFREVAVLSDYLDNRLTEVRRHNQSLGVADTDFVNGRRLTNIGTFRAYLIAWLRKHPHVRQDMTFLVRQKQPTSEGLPIEVYVFTDTTVWAEYEEIQANIFDHVLAVAPFFDLRVYQQPSGADMRDAFGSLATD